MTFYDGFVIAVPQANRDKFVAHARVGDAVFVENGATRVIECWQADVSRGKQTDFFRAVDARDDEAIVFSWIEWPDKATRDKGMAAMMDPENLDPRMDPGKNPMPFDGARMIYGGFETLFAGGDVQTAAPYVQGFLVPVPRENRKAYFEASEFGWTRMFEPNGAVCHLEAWGVDVPHGKVTDFHRAVAAGEDEDVVFSFVGWPSKAASDAFHEKMTSGQVDVGESDMCMPFDAARMVFGGFEPVMVLGETS